MNLNKHTKAELINKFRKLESKQLDLINNNTTTKNNSIFKTIIENILYFKAILLKITLIAIVVKIFKKYSIFRRI
jgi:hypothetical protein